MSGRRSPIEMMIDAACGVTPETMRKLMVRIRCPKCKREKSVKRDGIDPDEAEVMEFPCPACRPDGFEEDPRYFDAQGAEIIPDWRK